MKRRRHGGSKTAKRGLVGGVLLGAAAPAASSGRRGAPCSSHRSFAVFLASLLVVTTCSSASSRCHAAATSSPAAAFLRQSPAAATKGRTKSASTWITDRRRRSRTNEVGVSGGRRLVVGGGGGGGAAPLRQAALVPEENPDFDASATSKGGVRYSRVLSGLHRIFPPEDLESRNALSRTDGYWPFIQRGEDPPKQFTYGEFDFFFFAQLLDMAADYYHNREGGGGGGGDGGAGWEDKVFVDIGSGTGRLVLSAAALHPGWRLCRGVELLQKIHETAERNLDEFCTRKGGDGAGRYAMAAVDDDTGRDVSLPMAPVEFSCGSFEDPYVYFGDADCVFVFSSCMPGDLLAGLAKSVGRQCKPGTIVITTEFMLPLEGVVEPQSGDDRVPSGPYKLELLRQVDGWCWLTGGASTAYIHRVKESLWDPNRPGPLDRPEVSVEDVAFEVAKALEEGKLADPEQFKRGVYNNMVFHDVPESLRPKLEE